MADFVPFNEDHAIQAVTFAIALDQPLSRKTIESIQRSHHKWRADLPAVTLPPVVEVEMTPLGPSLKTTVGGAIVFSFLRPDGTPAWVLRLIEAEVAVECSRYTRWERVWSAANGYLKSALDVVRSAEPERKVLLTAFQVIDKFRAVKEPYNLNDLFRPNKYIAETIFDAGPIWHNHIGWFENMVGEISLQKVDLDARREEPTGPNPSGSVFVAATHLQQLRYTNPIALAAFDTQPDPHLTIGMNAMHVQNKKLISEILTQEMSEAIGLAGRKQ